MNRFTKGTGLFGAFTSKSIVGKAGGGAGLQVTLGQDDSVALTGTLRGIYVTATNGQTAATGTIRGAEIKARAATPGNIGANVATIEGISISVDAKNKTVTSLRGMEISLDGAAGGASTTAVGVLISNNSSATQTKSYAIDINSGTATGHKAFTADIRLQNGETIDNATDGVVTITSTLTAVSGSLMFTPISAPSTPAEGWVYYDSSAKKLKVYNGTAWETISSSS